MFAYRYILIGFITTWLMVIPVMGQEETQFTRTRMGQFLTKFNWSVNLYPGLTRMQLTDASAGLTDNDYTLHTGFTGALGFRAERSLGEKWQWGTGLSGSMAHLVYRQTRLVQEISDPDFKDLYTEKNMYLGLPLFLSCYPGLRHSTPVFSTGLRIDRLLRSQMYLDLDDGCTGCVPYDYDIREYRRDWQLWMHLTAGYQYQVSNFYLIFGLRYEISLTNHVDVESRETALITDRGYQRPYDYPGYLSHRFLLHLAVKIPGK